MYVNVGFGQIAIIVATVTAKGAFVINDILSEPSVLKTIFSRVKARHRKQRPKFHVFLVVFVSLLLVQP